jgi:methylmalonyl-CoA mutase cobalamin-binding subunit
MITSNVVEPWLYGAQTGISPLAVILAAVFWSWLWGGLGLILSVPLTVTLVVLGKNFPQLSFLSTLLGSKSSVSPNMQLYHRLLRRGSDEAANLVDDFQKGKPLMDVYDSLLVPTLALAKTDRFLGALDDDREAQLLASVKFLAEDLGERRDVLPPGKDPLAKEDPAVPMKETIRSVLCIPAADESDEIIAIMLSKLLSGDGFDAVTLSPVSSAAEKVAEIRQRRVDIVIISALPPGALVPARYLFNRIRNAYPDLSIVVGLWSQGVSATELKERFGADEQSKFATTLAEARTQVNYLAPRLALRRRPPVPQQAG